MVRIAVDYVDAHGNRALLFGADPLIRTETVSRLVAANGLGRVLGFRRVIQQDTVV